MPAETHRTRLIFLALFLSLLALTLLARPAHSGWGAEPVEVHASTARIPRVVSCADGAHGAIVVWQENANAEPGVLRAYCRAGSTSRAQRSADCTCTLASWWSTSWL